MRACPILSQKSTQLRSFCEPVQVEAGALKRGLQTFLHLGMKHNSRIHSFTRAWYSRQKLTLVCIFDRTVSWERRFRDHLSVVHVGRSSRITIRYPHTVPPSLLHRETDVSRQRSSISKSHLRNGFDSSVFQTHGFYCSSSFTGNRQSICDNFSKRNHPRSTTISHQTSKLAPETGKFEM